MNSQNTGCFINIFRQLGQETDRWSVLVQVHCVSNFHCQTPLITMSHLVESPHCILSDFLWWWQYVNFLCFVDHVITLLELLKSHQCRHVTLSWSQAGKRAFTFSNSVSLQRWLKKDTVLWNFEIDFEWETALSQSTDSYFF